ncbi:MAG: hypothetical protein ACPGF7_00500 [Pontibacterium sp.]
MIEFQKTLRQTDSCLISGGRQSGKLTLVFLLLELEGCTSTAIITPFGKRISDKKIAQVRELGTGMANPISQVDVTYLKDGWQSLKNTLGYEFILEDLKRIIQQATAEAVIIHRIDEFFDIQDRNQIAPFMATISAAAQEAGKTLFITLQNNDDHRHIFSEQVEKHIDLELNIDRSSKSAMIRDVDVLYSVLPIHHPHFSSVRGSNDALHLLMENTRKKTTHDAERNILLITADEATKGRLDYLFRHPNCILETIAPDLSAIVTKIMTRPDLIIYYSEDAIALDIHEIARDNELKLLRISNHDYVRKLDKLRAVQQGYFDLLEQDYFIEDLVLSIERALGIDFYSFEFNNIPNETHYFERSDLFEKLIRMFVEHSLYFSVFTFKMGKFSSQAKQQILLSRPYDAVYYDENSKIMKFFAPNMMPYNAHQIEAKVKAFDAHARLLEVEEACQFLTDKKQK